MKAWLKGGLIGGGIVLIYSILIIICFLTNEGEAGMGCAGLSFPGFYLFMIIENLAGSSIEHFYLYFITFFNILFGFIIGAIIGLIVGKIKSRKLK